MNGNSNDNSSASHFEGLIARWRIAQAAAKAARQAEGEAKEAVLLALPLWEEMGLEIHPDGEGGFHITEEKP